MAVLTKRLSKSVVDSLEPIAPQRQTLYWDPELQGFGVRVGWDASQTRISRSYIVKRRKILVTIDRTDVVSLDAARQRALELLAQIGQDINPLQERRRREEASAAAIRHDLTVRQVWEEFKRSRKSLRPKTLSEYEYMLTRYAAGWLDLPLRSLTRAFVLEEHTRIRNEVAKNAVSRRATGNSTANGVMRLLRALWNFADGNDVVAQLGRNPVQTLSKNRSWYPEPPREKFIPDERFPLFYRTVMEYRSPFIGADPWGNRDLVRLMLFTGLRLNEARCLRWVNVDLRARMIRLTADQTKTKRRLDLPMSDYVEELLQTRPRVGPWVFTGNPSARGEPRPVSDPRNLLWACAQTMAKSLDANDAEALYFNPHSLRRTFVTVAESCDLSIYTLKALVNHSFGDDITAIYVGRNDERLRVGAQRVTARLKELCRISTSTDLAPILHIA